MRRTREERFEELFREHYGAVRGYALRRMPGDVAQDVVSETFLVAWRRLSQHITIRQDGGQTYDVETRYRTYERLPLNARTDRLLALDPHPDAKCSEYAHELTEERDLGFPNPCR